ncbi:MAG: branched-chain amino acid ABC transporter substrate-binding protein [Mycobacteriales bacterium]
MKTNDHRLAPRRNPGQTLRLRKRTVSMLAVGLVGTLLAACGSSSTSTASKSQASGSGSSGSVACGKIEIGLVGPITGPDSSFGQADEDSAKLAIDNYNSSHPGCKVSLVLFDTQGVPSNAPPAATKAIQNPNIVAILGPEFSGEVEAAEPIFNQAGMPTVSSDATAIDLSAHGWKVFHRTVGSDGVEAPGEAVYTVKNLHVTSVAVINNGESYGAGIAQAYAQSLPKVGGKVVLNATINPSASNYSSTVLAIKGSHAQAVYCGCLYPEAARLLKQLRQGGVTLPFVSDSGAVESQFVAIAGASAAEGSVAGEAAVIASQYGPAKTFLNQYVAKFGASAAQTYAPEGYDAANAILKAIAAGKHSRSSINSYLATESFNGVSGHIQFQSDGNVVTNTVNILSVKNGTWQYLTQVTVPASLQIG